MKLKKRSWALIVIYILAPLLLIPLGLLFMQLVQSADAKALILTIMILGVPIGWALMYLIADAIITGRGTKKAAAYLDSQGFTRNYTFTSNSLTLYIDVQHGQIAVHYKRNPFDTYILDASKITNAYTDDGCTGSGVFRGSSRVRFIFVLEGQVFKVATFTSNRRFHMSHNHILEAISKADMYVEALNAAKMTAPARPET